MHLSEGLINHIHTAAPWVHIKYVLPGFTSVLQPCDTGLQKPLKDGTRDCLTAYITA